MARRQKRGRGWTWSAAELARLRRLYPNHPTADIATKLGRAVSAVYQRAQILGLHKSPKYLASPAACRLRRGDNVGSAHRFPKGHVPANKGLRRPGWHRGRMRETQFKKGQRPANWMPLGAHRINCDGYLERKVTTAGRGAQRWKAVHRIVWEEAHGPVPAGHAICFKAGRRSTVLEEITLDALELVHGRELMSRNTVHNLPKPLAQLVQLRGALNRKINARDRANEKQDH